MLKEYEKTKKDNKKQAKECESKFSVLNDELAKCYSKVDKIYKEYVKLLEEKKVLQGIHKVDADIHDKLKEAERKVKEKVVQSETDSEDGEEIEMVEFFINQRESRSNRNTPASNAENPSNKKATNLKP